jgi:hypothetical protein
MSGFWTSIEERKPDTRYVVQADALPERSEAPEAVPRSPGAPCGPRRRTQTILGMAKTEVVWVSDATIREVFSG